MLSILRCFVLPALASPPATDLVRHREVVGRIRGQDVGYHLVLPAGADGSLPVLVTPIHPTGKPAPDRAIPPPVRGVPWALLQLDGFNVLYARYALPRYLKITSRPRVRMKLAALERAALTRALDDHDLGADRLVCQGISASGNACWDLALRWPGVFAGILPVSAGYNPEAHPSACWANLAGQHVYVLHGTEDHLIDEAPVEAAVARAREEGATVVDVRIEGAGHGEIPPAAWHAAFTWAAALPAPVEGVDRCAAGRSPDRPRQKDLLQVP